VHKEDYSTGHIPLLDRSPDYGIDPSETFRIDRSSEDIVW
jgi:hypothetical protein